MAKSDYEQHLEVVNRIEETRKESWDYVEKRLYAIATGTLALSITLLTLNIEQGAHISCPKLIVASWICLVSSIILNFVSHIISYINTGLARNRIFDKIEQNKRYDPKCINKIIYKYNSLTVVFNVLSIIILLAGVIGVLLFYIYQIKFY